VISLAASDDVIDFKLPISLTVIDDVIESKSSSSSSEFRRIKPKSLFPLFFSAAATSISSAVRSLQNAFLDFVGALDVDAVWYIALLLPDPGKYMFANSSCKENTVTAQNVTKLFGNHRVSMVISKTTMMPTTRTRTVNVGSNNTDIDDGQNGLCSHVISSVSVHCRSLRVKLGNQPRFPDNLAPNDGGRKWSLLLRRRTR